jgi:glycosyltransferase involved in cell wall biosynthesis
VSDAGGLAEVVEHNVTGTTTYKGDPDSLAWGIARAVRDPSHSRWMAQNAYERVESIFNWDVIAADTRAVYERVWAEYKASSWGES